MPYVTSIERLAKQEGRAEGRAEMLIRAVERQYHVSVPQEMATRIRGTTDVAILDQWFDAVFDASTFEEFQQRMES